MLFRSFSMLHTNSASGVLPRLLDMDVEPFLIASTVNTVIGQRLVCRVSPHRDAYWSNPLETQMILETVGHLLPKTKEDVARVSEDLGYKDLLGHSVHDLGHRLEEARDATPPLPGEDASDPEKQDEHDDLKHVGLDHRV